MIPNGEIATDRSKKSRIRHQKTLVRRPRNPSRLPPMVRPR